MTSPTNTTEGLREAAERADAATSDNGHCGEGAFEYRERKARKEAAFAAFQRVATPSTVLALLERIKTLEEERDDASRAITELNRECIWWQDRASSAEAALDEALKAMEPFAKAARFYQGMTGGVHETVEYDDHGLITQAALDRASEVHTRLSKGDITSRDHAPDTCRGDGLPAATSGEP